MTTLESNPKLALRPGASGTSRLLRALLTGLLAGSIGGCSGDSALPEAVAPGTGSSSAAAVADPQPGSATAAATPPLAAMAAAYPAAAALEARIRAELGPELDATVIAGAAGHALEELLRGRRELPLTSWRREVFTELYGEDGFRPVYVGPDGRLSPRALAFLDEVRGAVHHAMDPAEYHLDELEAAHALLSETAAERSEWPLDDEVVEALVDRAIDLSSAYPDDWLHRLALEAVGQGGDWQVDALHEAYDAAARAQASAQRDVARIELLFADAFLSWTKDMSLGNVGRYSAAEISAAGGRSQLVADRLREAHRTARDFSGEEMTSYLESLVPHHEQYAALMETYARYRAIVDAGGWQEVTPRALRRGSSGSRVRALKERLAVEGYFTGTIDDEFDADLEAAVTSYQETHQMEVTGRTHDMFWDSVNVSAEHRLRQIAVTLGRWRESRIGNDNYYVFVNVPDFHAELWRDGERLSRFRVVTGNTTRECDPETHTMRMVNATPLISAEMEYMVLNPYWNVPVRIREDELDEEISNDPTWLQEHGYEVVVTGGAPRIRQLPGPNNALGRVKFIFPNSHNIYMHDTPRQRYFEYPIRAYSHGCVRVHEPLAFAELLLRQDGSWDEARFQRILDSNEETTIRLNEHVPVHIEYYVVRVDEQGRTHFLADVYRYDRERMGLPPDRPQRCGERDIAEALEESPLRWNPDGTAVTADGSIIHPDGRIERSRAPVARAREDGAAGDPQEASDFGP